MGPFSGFPLFYRVLCKVPSKHSVNWPILRLPRGQSACIRGHLGAYLLKTHVFVTQGPPERGGPHGSPKMVPPARNFNVILSFRNSLLKNENLGLCPKPYLVLRRVVAANCAGWEIWSSAASLSTYLPFCLPFAIKPPDMTRSRPDIWRFRRGGAATSWREGAVPKATPTLSLRSPKP